MNKSGVKLDVKEKAHKEQAPPEQATPEEVEALAQQAKEVQGSDNDMFSALEPQEEDQ